MRRLERILVRTLEIGFSICFLVMFALVVTQVALRYGLNESIGGANELATILFAYTSSLGIAVGIGGVRAMAGMMQIPVAIPAIALILGIVMPSLVGIVAGVVPARRAAALEPVEALR